MFVRGVFDTWWGPPQNDWGNLLVGAKLRWKTLFVGVGVGNLTVGGTIGGVFGVIQSQRGVELVVVVVELGVGDVVGPCCVGHGRCLATIGTW